VGSAYSGSVTATGGVTPYDFSVASGQLPPGLSLDAATGAISGTPSTAGSFTFGIAVSDPEKQSKEQPGQITVAAPAASAPPAPPAPPAAGNSFTSLQHSGGWGQYGQRAPKFVDCSPSPCDDITFSMAQGVQSPSISGDAAEMNLGGKQGFGDGLWNNHLIGPYSSQGMPDTDRTMVATLHDFTYDVYFYGDNLGLAQALEFDINQFFDNMGFIWGHQCRVAGGNEWDVWDAQHAYWKHTGIPCYPNSNAWNHLTIKVQRTSNDELMYQSITLNGVTSNLNWTFGHGSTPGWYGVTINYQMDGNDKQNSYSVYLDDVSLWYQ
jgi:hypothetical protein